MIRNAELVTARPITDVGEGSGTLGRVLAYLPGNYGASLIRRNGEIKIVVTGEDNAGWTLDGYVIPRLASGNLYLQEVN